MSHKIVFLDIDGTLTTFQGVLPDSARKALQKANQNGHHMIICTGRSGTQLYPQLLEKELFSGYITSAGADIRLGGLSLVQYSIPAEPLHHALDVLESLHAYYFLQCPDGVFADPETALAAPELISAGTMDPKDAERMFGKVSVREDIRSTKNCQKLCFYQAHSTIEEIQKRLGGFFETLTSSFAVSDSCDGEIMVRGYDKGTAMQKVLDATGTDRRDTIAFGDGPNDKVMLEFAQTGVAMGNASDDLKRAADLVTDRVDRDGLYKGFRMTGLIN